MPRKSRQCLQSVLSSMFFWHRKRNNIFLNVTYVDLMVHSSVLSETRNNTYISQSFPIKNERLWCIDVYFFHFFKSPISCISHFVSCCVRLYLFATVKRSVNKTYQSLIRSERRSGLCLKKIWFTTKLRLAWHCTQETESLEVVHQKVKRATKHVFDLCPLVWNFKPSINSVKILI